MKDKINSDNIENLNEPLMYHNNKYINKIIIHPSFYETIDELRKYNIDLPEFGMEEDWDLNSAPFPQDGNIITNLNEIKPYQLSAKNGQVLVNSDYPLFAYDESFQIFMTLEGIAYIFSHSIVIHGKDDYIPSILINFYFFTRSKNITQKSKYIIFSENPSIDSKIYYSKDRTEFIFNTVINKSIILIDGPLIGGQMSNLTIDLNRKLLQKNVIPIFIVKNSSSNLIVKYVNGLKDKFNSDMHWCYNFLKKGERTNFFKYTDKYNPDNGKVFCYLKAFDVSPQRIEIHTETYKKYQNILNELMDMIYYLILAQGSLINPQVRSIAIAEKFARESLKLFNLRSLIRKIGLKPTINQTRFGG